MAMRSTPLKPLESTINPVDFDLKSLGKRIAEVADHYPDRKSAAFAAGISTDQLARYMRGENQPSFNALAALARPHGISLDWLAGGEEGLQGSNLNQELLELILQTVEHALEESAVNLSPYKKAKLVCLLYSLHESGNKDAVQMNNVIRLIDYGKHA